MLQHCGRRQRCEDARRIRDVESFNKLMVHTGTDFRLIEHPNGGYGLTHHDEVVIDFPKCAPTRAAWCAFYYLEARTLGGLSR